MIYAYAKFLINKQLFLASIPTHIRKTEQAAIKNFITSYETLMLDLHEIFTRYQTYQQTGARLSYQDLKELIAQLNIFKKLKKYLKAFSQWENNQQSQIQQLLQQLLDIMLSIRFQLIRIKIDDQATIYKQQVGSIEFKESNNLNLDVKEMSIIIQDIQKFLDILRAHSPLKKFYSCKKKNQPSLVLGSIQQMRYYCQVQLNGEEFDVFMPDGVTVNCMFFRHEKRLKVMVDETSQNPIINFCNQMDQLLLQNQSSNPYKDIENEVNMQSKTTFQKSNNTSTPSLKVNKTVFLFHANGSFYEYHSLQHDVLSFYRKRGINVLMFNYRGCIKSQGEPIIKKIEQDSVQIYKAFRERYGYTEPLGLHGISIGSYFSIHLAAQLKQEEIAFVIADRSFGDLNLLIQKKFGRIGKSCFSCISDQQLNMYHWYRRLKCKNKLMIYDPKDQLVKPDAQLFHTLMQSYCRSQNYPEVFKKSFAQRMLFKDKAVDTVMQEIILIDYLSVARSLIFLANFIKLMSKINLDEDVKHYSEKKNSSNQMGLLDQSQGQDQQSNVQYQQQGSPFEKDTLKEQSFHNLVETPKNQMQEKLQDQLEKDNQPFVQRKCISKKVKKYLINEHHIQLRKLLNLQSEESLTTILLLTMKSIAKSLSYFLHKTRTCGVTLDQLIENGVTTRKLAKVLPDFIQQIQFWGIQNNSQSIQNPINGFYEMNHTLNRINYMLRPWSNFEVLDHENLKNTKNLSRSLTKSMINLDQKECPEILGKHISNINNHFIRVLIEKLINTERTSPIDGNSILDQRYDYTGDVLRIKCGHAGEYRGTDKRALSQYLERINFIKRAQINKQNKEKSPYFVQKVQMGQNVIFQQNRRPSSSIQTN
eukprot:403358425